MTGTSARAVSPVIVVGFGAVAVDKLLYVDQPYVAGKGRIVRRETSYGGNVATALAAVAGLGGDARFIGYLPDAVEWGGVHEDLIACGVDISGATVVPGSPPIRSTILITPDGERFIAFDDQTFVGAAHDLDLRFVTSAGALLIDGYGPVNGLRAVLAARAAGVPVVGDLEKVGRLGLAELQAAVGHLLVPMTFAKAITGAEDPEIAVDLLWNDERNAVVVTDGAHGSWFKDGAQSGIQHFDAFDVEVVDTTGCGDVYHGAYAYAIALGMTVAEAVARASAAAAVCATGAGGRGHLPVERDLHALISVQKGAAAITRPDDPAASPREISSRSTNTSPHHATHEPPEQISTPS